MLTRQKQYLRPRAILNSTEKTDIFQSEEQKGLLEPNAIYEYFGKKVTYINKPSKLLTEASCYKYSKSVTFDEYKEKNTNQ